MSEQILDVVRQRDGHEPSKRGTGDPDPWTEYLAATRQLDAVRRGASIAAGEQAQSVQAAREELTRVRARLVPQRARLRELGVPAMVLTPSPPEVSAASRTMMAGPAAVLAALRGASATVEAADAVLAGRDFATWSVALRNLLVYAPLALLVPILQVMCYLTAGTGTTILALLAGLPMPLAAFDTGWLLIGRLFDNSGEYLDRTPRLGVLVCLAPAALVTLGVGLVLMLD